MRERERLKKNREFLHSMASPLAIMDIVMSKMISMNKEGPSGESLEKQDKFLKQAKTCLDQMKDIHADFKQLQSQWELESKEG